MKKVNLFLASLLFSGSVLSQISETNERPDTVSVKEMITHFEKREQPLHPLDYYDYIKGVGSVGARLIKSPFQVGDPGLSIGNCHAVWESTHSQLMLKEILPIGITQKQADDIFSTLIKKYGGSREEGVLASWVTGALYALDCPYDLFGEWVSKEKIILTVNKGRITSYNPRGIPEGTMHNCKKEPFFYDGCWSGNLSEIGCLQGFINKNIESTFTFTERCYTLLLFTDLAGYSSIYVLEPEKLGWVDKKVIGRLKDAINLLPQGSFKYLETLDGLIFQGRYLKAKYTYRHGWSLEDYIHAH